MKYQITVGATIFDDYIVTAESQEDAKEQALIRFKEMYQPTGSSGRFSITVIETRPAVDTPMAQFGQRLRKFREANNISQKELAEMMDYHPSTVNHWEAGRNWPSMQNIVTLCGIFNISLPEIMGG